MQVGIRAAIRRLDRGAFAVWIARKAGWLSFVDPYLLKSFDVAREEPAYFAMFARLAHPDALRNWVNTNRATRRAFVLFGEMLSFLPYECRTTYSVALSQIAKGHADNELLRSLEIPAEVKEATGIDALSQEVRARRPLRVASYSVAISAAFLLEFLHGSHELANFREYVFVAAVVFFALLMDWFIVSLFAVRPRLLPPDNESRQPLADEEHNSF